MGSVLCKGSPTLVHSCRQSKYWPLGVVILKRLCARQEEHSNTVFCQCLKPHTSTQYLSPTAHIHTSSLCLSHTHSHNQSLLCLQKAGANDRLCVVCAHSAAPWTHFTQAAENSPLCFSLSICAYLSRLFLLSPCFLPPLEDRLVSLCLAVYISDCIFFLGFWRCTYKFSSGFGWHKPFTLAGKWREINFFF